MPDAAPSPDPTLHLPSLVIKNFRGIDELTIPRLGRVTLLAGKNGVGKTTVLDAVRIYAAKGRMRALFETLHNRDERIGALNRNGFDINTLDWAALFYGRQILVGLRLSIGSISGENSLSIDVVPHSEDLLRQYAQYEVDTLDDEEIFFLKIDVHGYQHIVPSSAIMDTGAYGHRHNRVTAQIRRMIESTDLPPELNCEALGPNVLDNRALAGYLDEVALTDHEERAIDALNLISDFEVQRVATVGGGQKVITKLKSDKRPVPLRSLGDGAIRSFAIALALAKSSGGFLLIDEAENGIHHSVQPKFWNMVLQTAQRNNVQVIATTHSWDCVTGFAQAANELEDVEGLLVRIERVPIGLRAITYDESRLDSIVKYGIEAR